MMLFPRLLAQHTSEAMHVQGNDSLPFGQIPFDLSTEHGRGHGVQDC